MHRLYRQHTTPHEDFAIKDLYNLGRDLSKTIIIDNLAENFNYTTP
jgi:CTD small phosphatase-like protein 2